MQAPFVHREELCSGSTAHEVQIALNGSLVSLMTCYAIAKQVDLGLNVDNLPDKKCALQKGDFDTVSYGELRNMVATLSYQY